MKVRFVCPSCDAAGTVDAVHIGKQVRCRHCGTRFAIPDPEAAEPDVYALEEPMERPAPENSVPAVEDAVFVPARAHHAASIDRPRRVKPSASGPPPMRVRKRGSEFPWQTWLIRCGVALVVILTCIALVAPQGVWLAGCILIAIGGLLVPLGFLAGAYGAFSEDLLYGILYLAIPLYTAYYLVTRWEDLWPWVVCATVGVGLVLIGTEMVRWSGVVV